MTKVVIQEVDRVKLRNFIIGMSLDTTASNTVLIQGASRVAKEFERTL